jgi:hypothetical protein
MSEWITIFETGFLTRPFLTNRQSTAKLFPLMQTGVAAFE